MLYSLANLPYWIILGFGFVLFILVMATGGGDDELDLEGDADAADLNAGGVLPILLWLGLGRTPLLLLLATDLSLWGLLGWLLNATAGYLLGAMPAQVMGWSGLIFLGSLVVSLYLGALLCRPIGQLLAPFGEDAGGDRLIGCLGTVTSQTLPKLTEGKVGQVDVTDPYNNLVTISAALPHWATFSPHRGDQVLVIDASDHSYLVIAKDSADEDRWLRQNNSIQDTRS